nr:MAG TPA: hypothetical protein [Caudoviricetes sp.]
MRVSLWANWQATMGCRFEAYQRYSYAAWLLMRAKTV